MGRSLNYRVPFRDLRIQVRYYFGNLKRGPNLEHYSYRGLHI